MKFANLNVATKIALGFAVPFLLFAGFELWLWVTIGNISGQAAKVRDESSVFALSAKEVQWQVLQVQQALTDISATRGQDGLDTGLEEAKVAYGEVNKRLAEFEQMFAAKGNLQEAAKIRAIRVQIDAYYDMGARMAHAYIEGGSSEGNKLMGKFDATREALSSLLEPLIKSQVNELVVSTAAVEDSARQTRMISLLVALLALLGLFVMAFLVSRSIKHQIGGEPAYAAEVVMRIAEGDLSTRLVVRDDDSSSLLAAMGQMQQKLSHFIAQISHAAGSVSTGAQQIASGNADLSQRTEEQSSALEQTSASMEELMAIVKQNAENALQANQLSAQASAVAEKGGAVVGQVVATMSEINESSRKIVDIISVIDSIAFQTNILALNAAVEAARAGEQGRGFAVVASEVRNLSQRSAAAAKEIKALISDSVGKVDAGGKLVDQAGKTMEEVVSSVKRVTDIMAEITTASQEQSSGISQVGLAVAQMDEATQQNAALVEESAAASSSMQEEAQNLASLVATFKLMEIAGGAASRQEAAVRMLARAGR